MKNSFFSKEESAKILLESQHTVVEKSPLTGDVSSISVTSYDLVQEIEQRVLEKLLTRELNPYTSVEHIKMTADLKNNVYGTNIQDATYRMLNAGWRLKL